MINFWKIKIPAKLINGPIQEAQVRKALKLISVGCLEAVALLHNPKVDLLLRQLGYSFSYLKRQKQVRGSFCFIRSFLSHFSSRVLFIFGPVSAQKIPRIKFEKYENGSMHDELKYFKKKIPLKKQNKSQTTFVSLNFLR